MIEGKAKIQFGIGDILITPLIKEDLSSGCVVLQNKGTHIIGEYTREFKKSEEDIVISIDNIESLNVFIERLEKLRDMMNGDKSDCYATIEYSY